MAASDSKALEFRVGLFVLVGLLVIAYMVIEFGRFGTSLKPSYVVALDVPDANGLLKNSKVLLSGASVGTVMDSPEVLPHARGVVVHLRIFESIQIPRNAQVVVDSSGLLGDRYVNVITHAKDANGYYQPGETIQGAKQPGMDDLTREGGALVTDLRNTVANLNKAILHINNDVLKEETVKNLQESLAHLNDTAKNFQAASDKLGGVIDDAHGAVTQARGVIDGAKDTIASAKNAADGVQNAIGDARKVLDSARVATDDATKGHGAVAALLTDPRLAENLTALISNLRRSGVLFYKDRAPDPAPPAASPAPRRR
jgi:ABC-type transporter Mla subunit MlaD